MKGKPLTANKEVVGAPELLGPDDAREAATDNDDANEADDGDDDAEVDVDADEATGALIRRGAVALPNGEWMRDAAAVAEVSDDELQKSTSGRDSLYTSFVRQATRLQRLSEAEERALGLRVRDGKDADAARKLVVHNLRLVIKMAHQYRRAWTNVMDLIQEGSAGMAIASQRWDPDQGTRFGTYAVYWIRAQLTKFLMTNGRAIHTGNTRAGRKLYFQLPRIKRKLLAEGKPASVANIAIEVQESEEEVARVVARLEGREASLDAAIGDDDGATLGDTIAGEDGTPETHAARREVTNMLGGMMQRFADQLSEPRDVAIWREHLSAAEPVSLVDLGVRFGVSKQRMGQLATRIKRSFRRHIIDELGPNTQLHWLFRDDT
jgi:RNA polymerase sigma-32 factor